MKRSKKAKIIEKPQVKIVKEFVNSEFLEAGTKKEERLEEEIVPEGESEFVDFESSRRTAAVLSASNESQGQPIEETLSAVSTPMTQQRRRADTSYESAVINAPQYSASYEQTQNQEPERLRVRRFEELAREDTTSRPMFQDAQAQEMRARQEIQEEAQYHQIKKGAEEERTRIPGSRRRRDEGKVF